MGAVFSDSAFVVAPAIATVGRLAKAIMNGCYEQRIPIRIGIGFGGYARLAFSTRALPSGLLIIESPFLGSAIVRAYAAQEKAPGFRIFIHPSAAQQLQTRWLCVDLPPEERTATRVQELNFLDMHRNPDLPEPADWDADLAAMRAGVTDARAIQHHDTTASALRRLSAVLYECRWQVVRNEKGEII